MQNDFLHYYNQELVYLREQGKAFASKYPKIASRLGLGAGSIQDPSLGRLIETFAFLTARIEQTISAEHDEIYQALIELLYPHYNRPIPAMSIIQFTPQASLDKKHRLPKHLSLACAARENESCYFQSTYPVDLWPIHIKDIALNRQLPSFLNHTQTGYKGVLTLALKPNKAELNLADLALDNVSFYINSERFYAGLIYELICQHVQGIYLSVDGVDSKPVNVPLSVIVPQGFSTEEALLPDKDNSFAGYRLLSEYFVFPEKFMFFALKGLDQYITNDMQDNLSIHFLLDNYPLELENIISPDSLLLGCSPIINLFEQAAVPFKLDRQQTEQHIVPDVHRDKAHLEVYAITEMACFAEEGDIECLPYFGKRFHHRNQPAYIYWHAKQKSMESLGEYNLRGKETFVIFSEFSDELLTKQLTIAPKLLCTNRELPNQIVVSHGKPHFTTLHYEDGLLEDIRCLMPFSKVRYRPHKAQADMDLIAHLNLNQTSFMRASDALTLLREQLSLYAYDDSSLEDFLNLGLVNIDVRQKAMRHPARLKYGICQGVEFNLTVDARNIPDNMMALFGAVMNQFLGQLASVNTVTKLTIQDQETNKEFQWQAQLGQQALV